MKEQIVGRFRQIDQLNADTAELWSKARKCLAHGHTDEAISLLNRYFSKKEELDGLEANLAGILKGRFSDK